MGCSVSALEESISRMSKENGTGKNMDNMQLLVDSGNTKFDPRLPLTVRQRFNIMRSWKGIARNIESTGVMMFMKLFETNEEVGSMFQKLAHGGTLNMEQLRQSKELENHVKQVMYTLDEAISSLENVDNVVQILHAEGRSHRRLKRSGFNPNVFWKIEEPFLLAVKETLGDRYSSNIEHIYGKTIKFILNTLVEGFNDES